MPSDRRKRTRDSDRDSRKTKKKKRHVRKETGSKRRVVLKKKKEEAAEVVISGAEDGEPEKAVEQPKDTKAVVAEEVHVNGKEAPKAKKEEENEGPPALEKDEDLDGKTAAAATTSADPPAKAKAQAKPDAEEAEWDFMVELVRPDWKEDEDEAAFAGTPPPSPGSMYPGTPSPPPPSPPPRRPRQFVIEYKGHIPTYDPSIKVIGMVNKRKKKKKKRKKSSGASAAGSALGAGAATSSPVAALAGATDPKTIRANAMMNLNTLRNKFSTNDFQQSLASLEQKFKQQNTWTPGNKEDDEKKALLFDKRLVFKPAGQRRKRKTALQLVDQGTFIAAARIMRKEAEEKQLHEQVQLKAKPTKQESGESKEEQEASELVLKGLPPVPIVEWWDRAMLSRPEMGYESQVTTARVTSHVDHPEVMRPDRLKPVDVPLPFYLTKAERRKKRRQLRKHKHETLTDEIRLGLRQPPEPKLNLENIIRVLGSQAIQDPTCAEAKARASMLKRKMEHELHNEKRRLTGKQKRDKKRAKLQEDCSKEVHVALYRVSDLSDGKKRYKVDINASQYNLTGRCIRIKGADVNMVVVEGGPKGIAKYDRLMMRRIRWGDDLMNASEANNRKYCAKVWQGVNRKRNFKEFQMKLFPEPAAARKHLDEQGAAHYWDQIETHNVAETF